MGLNLVSQVEDRDTEGEGWLPEWAAGHGSGEQGYREGCVGLCMGNRTQLPTDSM